MEAGARGLVLGILARESGTLADTFAAHWDVLLDETQTSGPHRQRTSVNKLRTVGSIADAAGGAKRLKRALKPLRLWQKALGPVRDLDVLAEWTRTVREAASKRATPGFDLALERLSELRRGALNELIPRALGEEGAAALEALREVRGWAADAAAEAPDPIPGPDELPAELVDEVVDALLRPLIADWFTRRTDAAASFRAEPLHEFRLANKRVRDVADLVARHVDPEWKPVADLTQALHRSLGNLNDLAVLDSFLSGERARRALVGGGKARRRLAAAASALDDERQRQLETLYDLWPGLFSAEFEAALRR
jgi:CHAD domain-containing protein